MDVVNQLSEEELEKVSEMLRASEQAQDAKIEGEDDVSAAIRDEGLEDAGEEENGDQVEDLPSAKQSIT